MNKARPLPHLWPALNWIYSAGRSKLPGVKHIAAIILAVNFASGAVFRGAVPHPADGIDATSIESIQIQGDGKSVAAGTFSDETTDHFAVVRYKSDGSLDPTFGVGGRVIIPATRNEKAFAMAIQADGKLVVAGYAETSSSHDVAVARLNEDGSLDLSFGKAGKATKAFGQSYARAFDVFVQPDQKIVAAGHSNNTTHGFDFAAMRFNTNGTPDISFGKNGIAVTAFGKQNNGGQAGALQTDGKIIVAGQYSDGSNSSTALLRYNSNGMLDITFGRAGKVITPYTKKSSSANRVLIQSDGKIIAAGNAYQDILNATFALSRYLPNGAIDSTFGNLGKLITPADDGASLDLLAIKLAIDGKIVVAGKITSDYVDKFYLRRYLVNGKPDLAFGKDGSVMTAFSDDGSCAAHALAIQSDGTIIAAGYSELDPRRSFALARYKADGKIDTSFGTAGMVTTSLGQK